MKLFDVGVEPVGVVAIGVVPRGIIAIGPLATGFIAIGQLARGFIALGQLAIGVVVIGQLGVGMWWSSAQLAIAPVGGPAMLRLTPYGVIYPLRYQRGEDDWRIPAPERTALQSILSLIYVIAIAVLVWFVAVIPAKDAILSVGR